MVASSTFTKFRGFRGTPGTPPGSAPGMNTTPSTGGCTAGVPRVLNIAEVAEQKTSLVIPHN